ncbi:hypothetical protein [Paraburkholderia unamae]|nr:hypothetical protein [Paraburkholderia unamae]
MLAQLSFNVLNPMQQSSETVTADLPDGCRELLREQFVMLNELVSGGGRNAFLTLSSNTRAEIESLYLKLANGLVARNCEEVQKKSICASPIIARCSCGRDGAAPGLCTEPVAP